MVPRRHLRILFAPALALIMRIGLGVHAVGSGLHLVPQLLRLDMHTARRCIGPVTETATGMLPSMTLITLALGYAVGLQAGSVLEIIYLEKPVIMTIQTVLMRDLVPLVVAVFVAGRNGIGLTVRIAEMVQSGESDGLAAMGEDWLRYVMMPAVAALWVAATLLYLWGALASNMAAALALDGSYGVAVERYLSAIENGEPGLLILQGLGRVSIYSFLILGIAAMNGALVAENGRTTASSSEMTFVQSMVTIAAVAAGCAQLGL